MTLDSSTPAVPSEDEEVASIEDEENQASGAPVDQQAKR